IGMDPNPINSDLSAPFVPRPGMTSEEMERYQAGERKGAELAGILVPGEVSFNEAEAAGLPRDARPYIINLEPALHPPLVNNRVYQFQLETLYGTALSVTLQRFAFMPQFFAGLSPLTGVPQLPAGASALGSVSPNFAVNLPNSFLYRTREVG